MALNICSNSGMQPLKRTCAILVDGAYTWNSSQVWSDNLSGTTNTKAFDGNVDTTCDPVEQLAGITYSSATPIFKSGDTVKIKTYTSNTGNNVTVGGIDGVTTIVKGQMLLLQLPMYQALALQDHQVVPPGFIT